MMTKRELIGMIVGLKRTNFLHLVHSSPCILSDEVCESWDVHGVRQIAVMVEQLFCDFEPTQSAEFIESIAGKSDAYKSMKIKMLTPDKRREKTAQFGDALADLMDSMKVDRMLRPECGERLADLRRAIMDLSNC